MRWIIINGKLNFYKANGYFLGSITGNEGDLTGLGNDTSYYNNDLYVQWETSDGKVSDKVSVGTFITGHSESTSIIPNTIPLKLI